MTVNTELKDPSGGFSMRVKVDGQDLQLYQIHHFQNDPLGSRSEGWIVSEPESAYIPEFCSNVYFAAVGSADQHPDLAIVLAVDGKMTESIAVRYEANHLCKFKGPEIDAKTRRTYIFSKPVLLEDEPLMGESEVSKLGSITVSVYRVKYLRQSHLGSYETPDLRERISEKEKKAALSLITKLGPAVPTERASRSCTRDSSFDPENMPYRKFTLRYGTKAQLRAMGIVPPDPIIVREDDELTHEPEIVDVEVVRKAEEEIRKAEASLAAVRRAEEDLERAQAALARAREQGESLPASRSGRGQNSKRKAATDDERKPDMKKVKVENGTLIDLTQDHRGGPIDLTLDDDD